MSSTNQVANTSTQQIVPVQATFNAAGVCTGLIGQGTTFSPPLSGNTENPSTISLGGNLVWSATPPTIASGFGTGPVITANSTAAFKVVVGTSPASTGVLAFPTAPNGWIVQAWDITQGTTLFFQQTASSATSATLTSFSITTGLAANMTAGDVILFEATAY